MFYPQEEGICFLGESQVSVLEVFREAELGSGRQTGLLVLFRDILHSSPEGCPRTDTGGLSQDAWRSFNTKPNNERCQFSCSHDQAFYPLSFLFHVMDEIIAL